MPALGDSANDSPSDQLSSPRNQPAVEVSEGPKRLAESPWIWNGWWLVAVLAIVVAVRVHCLAVPLDRDEGEFAYGGQIWLAGGLPYRNFYAMKLPGIYLVYAAIERMGGQRVEAIHCALLIVSLWNAFWVFCLGRRLGSTFSAALGAIAYAIWGISKAVQPTAAQAENFVLMFALPGFWLLILPQTFARGVLARFASGLCFGAAVVVKQHGAMFGLAAGAYLVADGWNSRPVSRWRIAEFVAFLVGLALPLAATCAFFFQQDSWNEFRLGPGTTRGRTRAFALGKSAFSHFATKRCLRSWRCPC